MPHDHDPCRDHPGYDQWYAESESSEPLSDGMFQLLRRELENVFYKSVARHQRDDCDEDEIRQRWCRDLLQRHHYFTNATWIRENGPHTIPEIITFHRSLCDSVSARLDDPVGFGNFDKPEDSGDLELRSSGDRPYSTKSWRSHGFTLGHLYRTMFIIIDDQVARDIVRSEGFDREARWESALSQYTVLLVKTGDNMHLSSPICFNALVESGMIVVVNRADVEGNIEGEEAVRMKLDVAMKFILDLVRREEKAIPRVRQAAELLREEHNNECQRWV